MVDVLPSNEFLVEQRTPIPAPQPNAPVYPDPVPLSFPQSPSIPVILPSHLHTFAPAPVIAPPSSVSPPPVSLPSTDVSPPVHVGSRVAPASPIPSSIPRSLLLFSLLPLSLFCLLSFTPSLTLWSLLTLSLFFRVFMLQLLVPQNMSKWMLMVS